MNLGLYLWMFILSVSKRPFPILVLLFLNFLVERMKMIIQERRPEGATGCDALGLKGLSTGYGMPSGHVATAVFASMVIAQQYGWNLGVAAFISGLIMGWGRTAGAEACHTATQSMMGGVIGFTMFLLTFKLYE